MSWCAKWKSKYVTIDPNNPKALGECDRSGFTFNHKDLHKQMEWRGNNLVWTGLMVGKPFLDKPNEQNRPPLVKDDPRPVKNPRPPTPYTDPESPQINAFSPQAIQESLVNDSFYDIKTPPYNPPGYIPPGVSLNDPNPIPGWQDPNPVPPYQVLLAELRKEWFQ